MSLAINNSVSSVSTSYASSANSTNTTQQAKETATNNKDVAAVYEGSKETTSGLYSINEMNQADRTAIANRLMEEFESKKGTMSSIVQQLFTKQGYVNELASLFTPDKLLGVSEAEIKQAQEDISEDGYFGIKQTSQRLFDFASALAGDDPEKMKKMEEAMEKGFKKAEKAWGQALPEISQKTMDAARQFFKDYYESRKDIITE